METNYIKENIAEVLYRMRKACKNANRNPEEVRLLLATKTVSPENVRFAVEHGGCMLLGENKVQEGLCKYFAVAESIPAAEWHFIGHLQSNKIKDVLKWATCIQSIDRIDLAEKLDARLRYEGKKISVLIQVNTSYEESKFGIAPEEAVNLAKAVSLFDNIDVKGVMTIGLFSAEQARVRKCFKLLKELQSEIVKSGIDAQTISMGMSHDMETAIEEGSTMIRVGTAIFGKRIYPDSHYWQESGKE